MAAKGKSKKDGAATPPKRGTKKAPRRRTPKAPQTHSAPEPTGMPKLDRLLAERATHESPGKARAAAPPPKEIPPRQLAERQKRFVEEYPIDRNATQAALRSGYAAKTAQSQGARLLKNAMVRAAIDARVAELSRAKGITVERVLEELGILGFIDMRDFVTFEEGGQVMLDWSHMPESASRAIQEITQEEYAEGKGKAKRVIRKTKFKLHPKTPALQLIAQHLKMLVQRHEHGGIDGKPIQTEEKGDARQEVLQKLEQLGVRLATAAAGAQQQHGHEAAPAAPAPAEPVTMPVTFAPTTTPAPSAS